MKDSLLNALRTAATAVGIQNPSVELGYPEQADHGDFSTNLALAHAKAMKMSPKALAEKILAEFKKHQPDFISSAEIAGPGFINFKLQDEAIAHAAIAPRLAKKASGQTVMVEYTDPNTFKVFHIGHLMSNAIGESLARLIGSGGAKVIRICYPSDIGLHIAKSVWAIRKHLADMPADKAPIQERTAFLGRMYVEGTNAYEADPTAKAEIDALNKVIYEKSDREVAALTEKGRAWSLEHFEILYRLLGTAFDEEIYESEMAPIGLDIVKKNPKKAFEHSEGAIVFKGENHGVHTRVFVNSQGLPTYEAKELGLNITKFERHPDAAASIIVTASEQNDYFKVLMKVISLIDEKHGTKMRHIGHGMMRFASGKMSSRTGNVITAEQLIGELRAMVLEKMKDRELPPGVDRDEVADQIAVAAVKYTVLRSSIGSDIVFDSVASISFEGDSGPYLQYSAVRANSVLEKAKELKAGKMVMPREVGMLERLLIRFDDIVARAASEYAPQQLATYLIDLAGAFNHFYNTQIILDEKEPLSPYRIELTRSFRDAMTAGLALLGIKVPRKM
jgi:arginyl-tRNA synthetase